MNVLKIYKFYKFLRFRIDFKNGIKAKKYCMIFILTGTSYKSPAYILKGGFDHFALSYPMWVTDPQKSRPPTANTRASNVSDINIENLEYPDLNKGFIKTPEDSPAAAVTSGAITMSNR